MSESALAISTLYNAVDRLFVAASGDAVLLAPPGLAAHMDSFAALVRKIGALYKHADARREALSRMAATPSPADCAAAASPVPVPASPVPASPVPASPAPTTNLAPVATSPAADDIGVQAAPALVEVVPGTSVPALLLPDTCDTLESVRRHIKTPALHYVPRWGHFAVRLGPHVIHGNVGAVYAPGERQLVGVKECRAELCRGAACTYYHSPAARPSGPKMLSALINIRNFTAESFVHQAAGQPQPVRYGGRPLGDYRTLGGDIAAATPASARLFLDQVGHDLVCAMVLLTCRPELAEG